jgi:hypothetical protein
VLGTEDGEPCARQAAALILRQGVRLLHPSAPAAVADDAVDRECGLVAEVGGPLTPTGPLRRGCVLPRRVQGDHDPGVALAEPSSGDRAKESLSWRAVGRMTYFVGPSGQGEPRRL